MGIREDLAARGLTTEEIDKVERNIRTDDELPTYYSASLGREIKISREFEQFLILLEDSLKNESIEWITNISELSTPRKDRDELLLIAIESELADSKSKLDALNAVLEDFDAYNSKFNVEKFANVVEVGLYLQDLQNQVLELVLQRDRMFHLQNFTKVINGLYGDGATNEDTQKQLKSWSVSFNEYRGSK